MSENRVGIKGGLNFSKLEIFDLKVPDWVRHVLSMEWLSVFYIFNRVIKV